MRKVLGIEGEHSDDRDFDARDPENIAATNAWRAWIEAKLLSRPASEWVDMLVAAGVPAAVVNFPEEMSDDPQANLDGMIVDMRHTITGPQRVVGPPVLMSATPTGSPLPAPALGEHTAGILADAGFTMDEIAALEEAGVVRTLS